MYNCVWGKMGDGGKYKCTAVYVAAYQNKLRALRFLLCAAGADPNADCGDGTGYNSSSGRDTPCWAACFFGHHDAVRMLVARGARPDHTTYTDSDKCTCSADIPHAQGCTCVQCT